MGGGKEVERGVGMPLFVGGWEGGTEGRKEQHVQIWDFEAPV